MHMLLLIASKHIRFLKDINNSFHGGSGINFHEKLVGVQELDEAAARFRHGRTDAS